MRTPFLITIGFCAVFSLACSRTEPRIDYGSLELFYYPPVAGGTIPVERYSFFVLPYDDDGVENLGELYLYHDREGLSWKLEDTDWVKVEEDNKTWIGSRNISMPFNERLPRGQFRAVLVNKAGEKTEKLLAYDGPVTPHHPYPFFSFTDGKYNIDSQYPVNRFICYDSMGEVNNIVAIQNAEGTLRDIRVSNNVFSMALWAEDEERKVSAVTAAISLRD